MPRRFLNLILLLALGVLGYQLVQLLRQYQDARKEYRDTAAQLGKIVTENDALQSDAEYYKNPENLAKELKSKSEYKRPGEELMIIVPKR